MNILITDYVDPSLIQLLDKHRIPYTYSPDANRKEVLNIISQYDGLIVRNKLQVNEAFLLQSKNLKFIARYGSGMESINIPIATELGITCFNSAEGNCNSVAEHAIGMLLSLYHNINNSMEDVRQGQWNREKHRGIELEGKTIGIIGYGNTGHALSKKLKGFNCSVLSYDKYKTDFTNEYTDECNMDQLFSTADIISLHIPLSEETNHLVNLDFINKMKKPFYLINTSRGNIVNTNDLIIALKDKKILGACLDVLENESSAFNKIKLDDNFNYLLNCKNIILTPHIAGLSKQSNLKLANVLVDKIIKLT